MSIRGGRLQAILLPCRVKPHNQLSTQQDKSMLCCLYNIRHMHCYLITIARPVRSAQNAACWLLLSPCSFLPDNHLCSELDKTISVLSVGHHSWARHMHCTQQTVYQISKECCTLNDILPVKLQKIFSSALASHAATFACRISRLVQAYALQCCPQQLVCQISKECCIQAATAPLWISSAQLHWQQQTRGQLSVSLSLWTSMLGCPLEKNCRSNPMLSKLAKA